MCALDKLSIGQGRGGVIFTKYSSPLVKCKHVWNLHFYTKITSFYLHCFAHAIIDLEYETTPFFNPITGNGTPPNNVAGAQLKDRSRSGGVQHY